MSPKLLLTIALLTLVLEGCTERLLDYTILGTKNIDVSKLTMGDRYSGKDCVLTIGTPLIDVPLGWPSWKTAADEALESGKGDILIDVVLTVEHWNLLIGQYCLTITGTVARTASYNPNQITLP